MRQRRMELLNNLINDLKEYRSDFQKASKVFVLYLRFELFSLFCDRRTLWQMCILEKLISTTFSSFFLQQALLSILLIFVDKTRSKRKWKNLTCWLKTRLANFTNYKFQENFDLYQREEWEFQTPCSLQIFKLIHKLKANKRNYNNSNIKKHTHAHTHTHTDIHTHTHTLTHTQNRTKQQLNSNKSVVKTRSG